MIDDRWKKQNMWKAIRKKCSDCCGGYQKEISTCPVKDCALYEYRFGKPVK